MNFQPHGSPSPATLAKRLLPAYWSLPVGEWRLSGDVLEVRHGPERTPVATLAPSLPPVAGDSLVALLEALPLLLDLIAPLPPRPAPGLQGARHRRYQERVIEEQQAEILALRETVAKLKAEASRQRERETRGLVPQTELAALRQELANAAREEAMLRELVTALARPSAESGLIRNSAPHGPA